MESLNSKLLRNVENIAMVGLSPDESKYSNIVASYLEGKGYNVIPVNPNYDEIMGKKTYNSLSDISADEQVELVSIFRPGEEVPELVREAIVLNVTGVWAQEGIISEEGKSIAEEKGVIYIMDCCIKKVHEALFQ